MKSSKLQLTLGFVLACAALTFGVATRAQAQTFNVLYTFTGGSDGYYETGGVIRDSEGNLYGTTSNGGMYDGGTAWKIIP